jgi:hypothetical protein
MAREQVLDKSVQYVDRGALTVRMQVWQRIRLAQ